MIIFSIPESIGNKNVIQSYYYGLANNNIEVQQIELNMDNLIKYVDNLWMLTHSDINKIFLNKKLQPNKYIFIQTEPLSFFLYQKLKTQEEKDNCLNVLKNAIHVFDYFIGNDIIMKEHDIHNYVFFPILFTGYYEKVYNESNNNKPNKKSRDKNIDIMFLGSLTSRRKRIIRRLSNYKCYINTEVSNKRKYNLHYDSKLYFSLDSRVNDGINFARLIPIIETKNYLVLETNTDIDAMNMIKDYIDIVPLQDYANKCKELIENPDIIDDKIEKAYKHLKKILNFDDYFNKIDIFKQYKR